MATIKISKENLYHNINQLALKTGNKEKIAIVLKDNAYGHGLELIAKLASEYGLTQAVVINTKEARSIKPYFKNILILNDKPVYDPCFSYAITELEALKSVPKNVKIELKVDTGMHRNGILMKEIYKAISIIKQRDLNLFGVFTHYRSADELSSELAWQMQNFEKIKKIIKIVFKNVRFHSFNSAALIRNNSFNEDIARVGIAIYGFNELEKVFNSSLKLKPVMSLWANRVSTRELKKGEKVGYGGDFIAQKDMIISTYNIGYGDGLNRGNSKKPLTTAENLPILGRVSMDFISLESTKEEICIFNNAQIVAKHFNTISYEITTSLKKDIPRLIV